MPVAPVVPVVPVVPCGPCGPVAPKKTQRPALHTCPVAQTLPQAPQLVGSVWVATQALAPEQNVVPAGQTQRQWPLG